MLTIILNNTIYKIKTGHGISAKQYLSDQLHRILGVGQGSCAAPSIWTAVLDTILWLVAEKYVAFQMTSPTGQHKERLGYAFVDNIALMANMLPEQNITKDSTIKEHDMTTHMKKIAQDFERKLFTTGGALALHKCFWYLIIWKWMEDGTAKMKTKSEAPGEIHLTQADNRDTTAKITRKEIDESERTLGVRLNPAQNMTQETEFRYAQIKKWAASVTNSRLSRKEVSMAYHRILLPMITYPLAVTTFTKKDTKQMQTLTDKTYKTQMKLNRNFPQAVYRGTPRYGGLGVVPITTHQAYKQIQLLIGSIKNGDSGGDLAQQSLESL